MIDKAKFKKFIGEIIKNNLDSNYDENDSLMISNIDKLYNGNTVEGPHSGFLAATFQTITKVQDIIDMDQQETLMTGEVKSIDSVWKKELLNSGIDEQTAEEIVDKHSFDFISVIQDDDE